MMIDIHNRKRQLERRLIKLERIPIIKKNKEFILKFKNDCHAEGIGDGRIVRCIDHLIRISDLLGKPFDETNKEDIRALMGKLETSKIINRDEPLSPSTKYAIKVILKKFYKWLRDTEEYPEEVRWIKIGHKQNNGKLPSDMLTEDDIAKLINAATNLREKAFISTLYESGFRISELMNLRIKDMKFDEIGAQLYITGKTGFRRIRVVSSVPYLQEWLNNHPGKEDHNCLVWIKSNGELVGYNRVRSILQTLKERAKISKEVNPHNFRHSRATYLAKFLTEAQMKEFFGWQQSSKMAAIYVHLSGRDVDSALLKSYGIEVDDGKKEQSKLNPIKCIRCSEVNESTNKFCKKCGLILNEETKNEVIQEELKRNQADELMGELVKDKEILELLLKKIKEKGLVKDFLMTV